MPFGAIGSVYAWHRMGCLLQLLVTVLCKAACGRYVDDFFGASRAGVTISGGKCLTALAHLLGIPCDDAKDADDAEHMTVLGAVVVVHSCSPRYITMQVDYDKALRWASLIAQVLSERSLPPGIAAKLA
eukprot:4392671-Amphidinium_carterae.1